MTFTIGKTGVGSLLSLGRLMGTFHATCLSFIFVVLGLIARFHGLSIWKFINCIKDWTGDLDVQRMRRHLDQETPLEADDPEIELDQQQLHMPATA